MDFFRKTKGVISVFLIIIMLPLLTSAVILVDGTRYHSAKMMAQEAGDLAAYSTIANYNIDLKDEYGLFAIDDDNISAIRGSCLRPRGPRQKRLWYFHPVQGSAFCECLPPSTGGEGDNRDSGLRSRPRASMR